MATHSDITVVIPCFNHGRFLLESVERALGQDGGPPKVIVVDDGSTDEGTLRALDEVPAGIEVIRQQNAGVSAARNAGFENSESELLLMVDADDRLTPDALDVLRPPLEAHPDVGYCYGLMKLIGTWSGVLRFPDFDPYILLHRSIAGAQLGLVRLRCWDRMTPTKRRVVLTRAPTSTSPSDGPASRSRPELNPGNHCKKNFPL